jgi:hypothetical protein
VAVSANITYQTIQSQFSQAGLFPGFRYATDPELSGNDQSGHNPGQVHSLFESAGLGEGFSFLVDGYGLVPDAMGFFGFPVVLGLAWSRARYTQVARISAGGEGRLYP